MTNTRARTLFNTIYRKGQLTYHQMIVVRKGLAYAWEICGNEPGGNYPGVKEVWSLVSKLQCADQKVHVLPTRIPKMVHLKAAFTKEWDPEDGKSLIDHMTGCVAGHDWGVFGMRSSEDFDRVKKSRNHYYDWEDGWHATAFKGGRAKLHGTKKGTRPWRVWTTCFCKGAKHIQPPKNFYKSINVLGMPTKEVTWCTTCPLACIEVLFAKQSSSQKRRYPLWIKSGRFGEKNINDVANHAISWFVKQGVVADELRYDRNAGRKSLAVWTNHLNIPYEESFQVHGDLWSVWAKNYEKTVKKSGYKNRKQSLDHKFALMAQRKLANHFGRGKKMKRKLTAGERLQSEATHCILCCNPIRFCLVFDDGRLPILHHVLRFP
jgi:hypothetical protein